MIIWYKHLYYEGQSGQKVEEWKRQIENQKLMFPIYCITLPTNPKNLLDIIPVNELLFPYYKRKNITVVGLAGTKMAAMQLVARIVDEVYKKTGGFDLQGFIQAEQNKESRF
ncbi:MAG: hypothetical protein II992_04515 [Lachnospiraceae bacterium]|nr:hypothetical protein [Lachnospiraceae bacterium]